MAKTMSMVEARTPLAGEQIEVPPLPPVVEVVEPEPVKAPRKLATDWADAKKIGVLAHPSEVIPAKEQQSRDVIMTGVAYHHRWPVGAEMTEAEFDAAVAAYMQEPIR